MEPSAWRRGRRLTRRSWMRAAGGAVCALTFAPALASCGPRRTSVAPTAIAIGATRDGGAGAKPARGGTLTLRGFADASSLDYAFSHDVYSGFVIENCVETLVTHDAQARAMGLLAANWENPDSGTYVFKLRPDVTFQDGTELAADAVEYSMNRIRGDKTAFHYQDLRSVERIERPDRATITITLAAPFAPFLEKLSTNAGRIISPAGGEKHGNDRLKVDLAGLGSGPFKFLEWKTGDHATLVRNERYWGRDSAGAPLPYVDKVVVRAIPDGNLALSALRNGELDAFRPGEGPPSKDAARVITDPSLRYGSVPGLGFSYIALNQAREPFNSRELRQAVSYAVDRDVIVRNVFFDTAVPLDVIFAPSSWANDPDYHPYLGRDLGKARQLLARAGRAGGFSFTYTTSAGDPNQLSLAELIKDQLKEAGIEMAIEEIEFGTLTQALSAGRYQAAFLGWTATYDPDDWVYSLFSTKGSLIGRSHYSNPDVDLLLEQARARLDPTERKALYQQAQRLIVGDAVVCVLCDKNLAALSRRGVRSLPLGPTPAVGVSQVWKET